MSLNACIYRSTAALAAAFVLLTGCQKKEEATPPAPVAAKPTGIISAEKNSFNEVTSKLDPGGNLYLYLSTEQAFNGLTNRLAAASNMVSAMPNIPGTGKQTLNTIFMVIDGLVQNSGVTQISGVGMSSIAREPGFYFSKMVVHHYPGQNEGLIWSLFGQSPHPLQVLDMLPDSTAMATDSDFDLALAWTNIQQAAKALNQPAVQKGLEQVPTVFKAKTGLDLDATLQSLGGEFGFVLTLDQHKIVTLPLPGHPMEIPSPGLVLICKVKSDLIFDRVDQVTKGNPLVTKKETADFKMRTMTLPIPLPVELRPSLARVGDYLLFASSDTLIKQMIAVKAGKEKGFKSTDEFKRLAQGIPAEGNNFSLVSSALSTTLTRSMTNQPNGEQTLEAMKKIMPNSTNSSSFGVGANGVDGWEGIANGSQSLQAMIAPLVVVVGAVAAVAVPKVMAGHPLTEANVAAPGTEPGRAPLARAFP